MGYGPRQGVHDNAWAVLKYLVYACKNKSMMGKLLFVQKRKKLTSLEGKESWSSHRDGADSQGEVHSLRLGQTIRWSAASEKTVYVLSPLLFSCVYSCFFLCYKHFFAISTCLLQSSVRCINISSGDPALMQQTMRSEKNRHSAMLGRGGCN